MNCNPQLHVVGCVKTLQLFVQNGRVGHFFRFQWDAAFHIAFPGMFQTLYRHQPGLAFQQFNLHRALMDALGRQIGLADHVPFIHIQVIDSPGNGVQIRQRDLLPDIRIDHLLDFRFAQHFRRIHIDPGKVEFHFCHAFFRLLLHIGFHLRLLFLQIFFHPLFRKLPVHVLPRPVQLGAGIVLPLKWRRPRHRSPRPGQDAIHYRRRSCKDCHRQRDHSIFFCRNALHFPHLYKHNNIISIRGNCRSRTHRKSH